MVNTKEVLDLLTEVKDGEKSPIQAGELIYILFYAEQQFNMNVLVNKFNEDCGFLVDSSGIPEYVDNFLSELVDTLRAKASEILFLRTSYLLHVSGNKGCPPSIMFN